MKRHLIIPHYLLIVTLFVAILAGCGGSTTNNATTVAQTEATTAATTTAAAETTVAETTAAETTAAATTAATTTAAETTAASAPTTDAETEAPPSSGGAIKFATWQWGEAGVSHFYRYASEIFADQNPGWTIEEVHYPFADYWDKMLADVSAGSPPDIFMGDVYRIGAYTAMGALEPFESYASPELMNDFNTVFLSITTPPVRVDGKTYGLPVLNATIQLMYNDRILREAGVAVPTNTEEFIAAAKALTRAPDMYGYAFMTLNEDAFYDDIVLWMLGQDENVAGGKITVNTPGAIQGMMYYKELFDAQTTPIGVDKATYRSMFSNGQVAMLLDGPWVYSMVQNENAATCEDIRTAVFPAFPSGKSQIAGSLLYLAAAGQNKEIAWKMIEICASREMQGKYVEYSSSSCARTDAISPEWLAQNQWFQGYIDGAAGATAIAPMDYLEVDQQIRKIVIDAGQDILFNNIDPSTALNKAQDEMERIYAAY